MQPRRAHGYTHIGEHTFPEGSGGRSECRPKPCQFHLAGSQDTAQLLPPLAAAATRKGKRRSINTHAKTSIILSRVFSALPAFLLNTRNITSPAAPGPCNQRNPAADSSQRTSAHHALLYCPRRASGAVQLRLSEGWCNAFPGPAPCPKPRD